jgi:hypothetical protein|tara:strand:+ start:693 stop:941 length:249 start_codon:yes stop_codon:yes gene_type:complete
MSGIEAVKLDELAEMDEDELRARMRNIRRSIRRAKSRVVRAYLEVECCYFHREIEIREQRRAVHAKWMTKKREQKIRNKEIA